MFLTIEERQRRSDEDLTRSQTSPVEVRSRSVISSRARFILIAFLNISIANLLRALCEVDIAMKVRIASCPSPGVIETRREAYRQELRDISLRTDVIRHKIHQEQKANRSLQERVQELETILELSRARREASDKPTNITVCPQYMPVLQGEGD